VIWRRRSQGMERKQRDRYTKCSEEQRKWLWLWPGRWGERGRSGRETDRSI
jgi:hypothetical protein